MAMAAHVLNHTLVEILTHPLCHLIPLIRTGRSPLQDEAVRSHHSDQ
jgi:hypothetical protein